jgi:hypothetical protein
VVLTRPTRTKSSCRSYFGPRSWPSRSRCEFVDSEGTCFILNNV